MSLYISNTTLIIPSINTPTFLSHNFQCNFNFVFFLGSLVKVLCLMIISFHSLICVQLTKTTLILKRRECILFNSFLFFIVSQICECTLILCPSKTSSYKTQQIIFVYFTHSLFLLYPF